MRAPKGSALPCASAYGPPVQASKIDPVNFVVRRVEELFQFADQIEQKANAALERVNNLTQSILAKALDSGIHALGALPQPLAAQIRSRRICRGELTADWRAQNPDFRRMERIQWPKPVIENETDPALKVWSEKRGSSNRIHIWLESEAYLVVLDERKDYYLPWTAFFVEREHERRKLNKRWERNRER